MWNVKNGKFFILLFSCLITSNLFAQNSPQAIETDLLKAFRTIDYNGQNNDRANNLFAGKLQSYTEKYPFTIKLDFTSLKAEHLDINTSTDGLFRIYSWDTWTGGSMHFFESLFQYKYGTQTIAVLDTPKTEGDSRPNYYKLYTFKANGQTYYLSVYRSIGSSKEAGQGISIFTLQNGKLNDAKLIKTQSGLKNKIYYDYDFFSVVDIQYELRPSITFDASAQSILIPLVMANGKVTSKVITYKFTGRYFEKVKS